MGHAIVTGGSSGIGLDIARTLAEKDCAVTSWDVKSPPEGVPISFVEVDMANQEAIRAAAVLSDNPVDVFVHCAGKFTPCTILDEELADIALNSFKLHTVSFMVAVQSLLERLAAANGTVVAIASSAMDMVNPGTLAYGASKAALGRTVKQLAVELAGHGIRVNGVAPGSISTPMTEHLWRDPEFAGLRTKQIPLGRQGETRHVSKAVAYLTSPGSEYVTGEMLWVDGGVRHGIFNGAVRLTTGDPPD